MYLNFLSTVFNSYDLKVCFPGSYLRSAPTIPPSHRNIVSPTVAEILVRINRVIFAGRYAFGEKARIEMEADG